MKQKSVGLTLRAAILALALILVAGSPALPPFDGVAYAQDAEVSALDVEEQTDGTLELTWTEVVGASSYRLWKGEGSGRTVTWGDSVHMTFDSPTVVSGKITYVDSAVTDGMTYSYVLEIYDGDDNRLGWSDVESVTIGASPVQKPTDKPTLTLTPDGRTAIIVGWTEVAGADTYRVRYWTSGVSGGWQVLDAAATGRSFAHRNLTPGKEYFYTVAGQNDAGRGPYSGEVDNYDSHTLEATTAVPELSLTHVDRTTVTLVWTETTDAVSYDLEREKVVTGGGAETDAYARLPSSLLTGLTYTDSAAIFEIIDGGTADAATVVRYNYRVQAIDGNGVRGTWSNVESVVIPADDDRLAAPAMPSAAAQDHANINFSWDGVAGATYYYVEWKTGSGAYSSPIRVDALADASSRVTYNHSDLNPSTAYTYKVRAWNINGFSDYSTEMSATTPATPAVGGQMPRVSGLRLSDETDSTGRKIELTWNAVSGATHYDIIRFHKESSSAWAAPANQTDSGLTSGRISSDDADSPPTWEDADPTLAAGGTYYYAVSAVDNRGTDGDPADDILGAFSARAEITLKDNAPAMPTNLNAEATGERAIWVSWTQPPADTTAEPPIGTATSWTLEWRLTGANAAWNPMTVTGTTYNHTNRRPNTQYHYRVRANNSDGMSAYTAEEDTTTSPSALGPPSGLTAVDATTDAGVVGVKVSWDAVTGASGYEIQRFGAGTAPDNNQWGSLTGSVDPATNFTAVSGTMETDANTLTANTTYFYRVRTVAGGGVKSQWSAPFEGKTRHAVPTAPTLVAASTGMSMIRLSWTAVTDAVSYELEFLEGMHGATTFDNDLITRGEIPVAGADSQYVHSSLKTGTKYSYRVRALLPQGVESPWSTVVEQHTKPAQPAGLSARATISTTMVVTWTPVAFVDDNGTANTLTTAANYQVERRESGSSTWTTVDASTTACAADECTLSDNNGGSNLEASTHYYYRVRATVSRRTTAYTSYWAYTNQRTPQ
ncbi:MAG: fibronectin type III domain-containing protein [Caldilineaceae bacterium]|nr:fibronectin type III domain-containing protein [Caldilineaceae bacterium]